MKEEWLLRGAVVPVDVETTAALVAEIKRLIDVVGGLVLKQGPDYERGFIDGMQKQAKSSVDKAVNRMAQPEQKPESECNPQDLCAGCRCKYAAQPPQRVPLTDKQILADETLRYCFGQNGGAGPVSKQGRKVVDAIEAAHGIKGEA
jgi:hypothetical protein